ncbi:MAG: acyl transferase [Brumimicrobium sp.]|nr:acyl transferase [Brumimicrobium sp.]
MEAKRNRDLEERIFSINGSDDFNRLALEVFHFQYEFSPVYRKFCEHIKVSSPGKPEEIPFLPISFFKNREIILKDLKPEITFKSSGTTGTTRSEHAVAFKDVYKRSFTEAFSQLISDAEDMILIALLPNYLEQGDSSLIYMVDHLMKKTNNPLSGFYLNSANVLKEIVPEAKRSGKQVVLIGVSYALLDLARLNIDLSGVTVIETGGMKGRRKEMIRDELHEILRKGLRVSAVFSEYGMTELLSQAYLTEEGYFRSPPWMKIFVRDINDPLTLLPEGKTGGVNVIDLANLYSCSFIATDDLGAEYGGVFNIFGRFDNSDIRGCNLLIN